MKKTIAAILVLLSSATVAQAQIYGPGPSSAEPSNPYYGQPNNAPPWAQPYQPQPIPSLPSIQSPVPYPSQGPTGYPCTMPGCR